MKNNKKIKKKKIDNEVLKRKTQKIINKEKLIEILELHYSVSLSQEDKEKYYSDLFPMLWMLSSKEINKLVYKRPTDKSIKMVYDIFYFRDNRFSKSPATHRAYETIKNL